MDAQALLAVPHRSVHWAQISKQRDSNYSLSDWKRVLTWEAAHTAPHVFSEAISTVLQKVLDGQADIRETAHVLSALVAPLSGRADMDETACSWVIRALVRMVAAGADLTLFPAANRRASILREALEQRPQLWMFVWQHLRGCVIEDEFGKVWVNVQTFWRSAIVDVSVPAWAQQMAIDTAFAVADELEYDAREADAATVLEWAAETASGMVQPTTGPTADQSDLVVVDTQGRPGPLQLLARCAVLAGRLARAGKVQGRIASVISELRLMAASLTLVNVHTSLTIAQTQSPWLACDKVKLARLQLRLLQASKYVEEPANARALVDTAVWMVAAYRVPCAFSSDEQTTLLRMIETIWNNDSLDPRVAAVARLPLLSIAADGFTGKISTSALELSAALDNKLIPAALESGNDPTSLMDGLHALAGEKWCFGALPLLISWLRQYLAAGHALTGPADQAVARLEVLEEHPLLLAPFLCAWSGSGGVATSKLALAALLRVVPQHPALRQHLLALFVHALRQPGAPADLRQALLMHAIPALVSASDAYATARVVAFIADLWRQGRDNARISGMAVRAWAQAVRRNARVWRDLHPIVAQLAEHKKARTVVVAAEYEWAVLTTARDLVLWDAERYAEHVLPIAYALLRYVDTLSASSTALMIEAVRLCVEAGAADVRGAWAVAEAAVARWGTQDTQVLRQAGLLMACVGRGGDGTEVYAAFRQRVLMDTVAPLGPDMDWVLAAFPADEITSLITETPTQAVVHASAELMAARMDHEVRFMRRTALRGRAGQAATTEPAPASWAQANAARCEWLTSALDSPVQRACEQVWGGSGPGFALAALVGGSNGGMAQAQVLVGGASLADHWTLRCAAADAWQMWFAADSDPAAALDALCAELRTDHVPARTANVLYAVAGLLRATQAADTARAAELSMRALRALRDAQLLPDAATFGERDAGVAGAAVECLGHVAAANAHDSAALGHAAQQLMGTAARMSGLAALAAARALMQVYTALAAQPAQSAAGDDVVAEADDVRRSLERLNVLDMRADAGGAGLAMALAAMHRDWLTRALDPAQADANTTPRAATALRTVARTLAEAHARVQQSDVGAALPSLFYLSFVWPPRPIAQRHIELQPELLSVTPDRVWPSCMRLLRAARALGAGADTAGLVEIAAAVLTHHQQLTAGQTAAHARLVGELAGWVRGLTDDSRAADEQQALQAARVVALGIALGVPLHGVAETTVSNAYLPAAQRRSLSVLLSVGSVQHGSTAWLRLSEPVLHDALAALVACAGLADTEVGNVRAARVAGFVLSVLRAQSVRAEQLLAINEEKSGQPAAGDNSVDLSEDVEPDMIEPASLVHLPAPTSWCRAVWESICDLSAALPDPAVERRLVRLLSALLIAERPFPAVDMQPVLRHIVDVHLQSNAGLDQHLPLLRLAIEVSDKLSQVLHSAAQFIDDASVQVVRRAVELARAGSVERVDAIYSDTLLSIALMCVGRHGLGRVLSLAGLSAAGEGREPAVPTDLVRIVGTTEFYARHRLTLALALPCNRRRSEAESDAARMFRVASRVAVSAPRAMALCTRLVELVFSADEVACLALQLRLLATTERHVANPGTVDSREVARESARAQISEMALSISERSECVRVRRAALAVACGGANESRGHELLASDLRGLGDSDLCLVLQRQALVLELWIGTKADPGIAQVRGVVGGWLKQLFKEWTRRSSNVLNSMVGSLRTVATALYSQRANDRVKCEWIVNALDLGILALSNGHESIVRTALTCWLLPLLTGYGALEPELLSALGGELVEYVEAEAAEAGQKRMRQYSALLRTRAVGLLDLTTDAKFQRALRRVLASLAMLGKLPAADLSRI